MKVAIVHDYIKEYGGAERVLEALHELYPDAPIFTSVYLPKYLGPHQERFKDWHIKTSFLQSLPWKAKLISPMRLLAPLAFLTFDFSGYDVVIVSATGAYTPNFIRTKIKNQNSTPIQSGSKIKSTIQNTKVGNVDNYILDARFAKASARRAKRFPLHICYCHTPPRYLYGYATARDFTHNSILRIASMLTSHVLRIVDSASAKRVDFFIANSEEVRSRIKKFYNQDAAVIYPPVDIENREKPASTRGERIAYSPEVTKRYSLNANSYYVAGGRLARPKHIDLIVRACRELDVPLKVFGKAFAGYGEELKKLAGPTIEFLGEVSDEEKFGLMKNAKAYIFAAEDEDFGITPVEAMLAGTPVIAYRSGGVKETVVEGKTGIFFDQLSVESLEKAMTEFDRQKISSAACHNHAILFNTKRFDDQIRQFLKEKCTR